MEEVIETKKEPVTTEEVIETKSATSDDIKTNEELLKANAEISALREQLQKAQENLQLKEKVLKEESFNKLLTKFNIKPEFQKFVKMELQWENISDLNKAVSDFVKENPALVENLTTGGTETTITNDVKTKSENPLLKFKKENHL